MLLKVRRAAQITLPAKLRKLLNVEEGDLLEAEIVEQGILLKPVSVVDRERAWNDLTELVDRPKSTAADDLTPDEEERLIAEEVVASRKDHARRNR